MTLSSVARGATSKIALNGASHQQLGTRFGNRKLTLTALHDFFQTQNNYPELTAKNAGSILPMRV